MLRPPALRLRLPAMALVGTTVPPWEGKAAANQPQDEPTPSAWAYEPATRCLLDSRTPEGRGSLRCYVCCEAGHMAHECPKLPEAQRDKSVNGNDAFLHSTRGHKKVFEKAKDLEQRDTNRWSRIAVVQALTDGIDQSDEEEDARRTANSEREKPAGPPPSLGEF